MLTRFEWGMSMFGTAWRSAFSITCVLAGPAVAQAQGTPSELLRFGSVATLAPLCGLRDEAWAFDLRRAEIQSVTRSPRFDDQALRAAPGSDAAIASLSYAETEALEDFAEAPPDQSCGTLARSPDLTGADEIVRAFRAQRGPQPGS